VLLEDLATAIEVHGKQRAETPDEFKGRKAKSVKVTRE